MVCGIKLEHFLPFPVGILSPLGPFFASWKLVHKSIRVTCTGGTSFDLPGLTGAGTVWSGMI